MTTKVDDAKTVRAEFWDAIRTLGIALENDTPTPREIAEELNKITISGEYTTPQIEAVCCLISGLVTALRDDDEKGG